MPLKGEAYLPATGLGGIPVASEQFCRFIMQEFFDRVNPSQFLEEVIRGKHAAHIIPFSNSFIQ